MEWKSVKRKLPRKPGRYLCVDEFFGIVNIGEFDGVNSWNFSGPGKISHWMPLPKPPVTS